MIEKKYEPLYEALRVVVYIALAKKFGRGKDVQVVADSVAEDMLPHFVQYNNGFTDAAIKKERNSVRAMLEVSMRDKNPTLQSFKDLFESYAG